MGIQLVTKKLFDEVTAQAVRSPRRRMNYNFHSGPEDNPHRFLNVLLQGTYIRPHRHFSPAKTETFLVLEGEIAFFHFDDEGRVTGSYALGPAREAAGIDVLPGVWHTLTALSPRAICFEVKPGPWEAASDKEFAAWAPEEDDAGSVPWLQKLLQDLRTVDER